MNFSVCHLVHLFRVAKKRKIQAKSYRTITEQSGVVPEEGERGLKNWIAFFWRVTACSLKDNISEETTAYIFKVERKGTKFLKRYMCLRKKKPKQKKYFMGLKLRKIWTTNLAPRIMNICMQIVDRDSSVGIATRYGLDGSGIESRWKGVARFSVLVQTGSGAHPDS